MDEYLLLFGFFQHSHQRAWAFDTGDFNTVLRTIREAPGRSWQIKSITSGQAKFGEEISGLLHHRLASKDRFRNTFDISLQAENAASVGLGFQVFFAKACTR
jgi:hypothetical protein